MSAVSEFAALSRHLQQWLRSLADTQLRGCLRVLALPSVPWSEAVALSHVAIFCSDFAQLQLRLIHEVECIRKHNHRVRSRSASNKLIKCPTVHEHHTIWRLLLHLDQIVDLQLANQ